MDGEVYKSESNNSLTAMVEFWLWARDTGWEKVIVVGMVDLFID